MSTNTKAPKPAPVKLRPNVLFCSAYDDKAKTCKYGKNCACSVKEAKK